MLVSVSCIYQQSLSRRTPCAEVWSGPTDVWKVNVSEITRVVHRRELDDGVILLLAIESWMVQCGVR